jgi:hypothetical protein
MMSAQPPFWSGGNSGCGVFGWLVVGVVVWGVFYEFCCGTVCVIRKLFVFVVCRVFLWLVLSRCESCLLVTFGCNSFGGF